MVQLLHAQFWNFSVIKGKLILECSSMQIMQVKMAISILSLGPRIQM